MGLASENSNEIIDDMHSRCSTSATAVVQHRLSAARRDASWRAPRRAELRGPFRVRSSTDGPEESGQTEPAPTPAAPSSSSPPPEGPKGHFLAAGSVGFGVALFLMTRVFSGPSFAAPEAGSVPLDEALANADSPSNLHNLISNAPTTTSSVKTPAPTHGGRTTSTSSDDLSSIKLDLDALG